MRFFPKLTSFNSECETLQSPRHGTLWLPRCQMRIARGSHVEPRRKICSNNLAILYGKSGDWQKSYFWLSVAEGMGATENKPQLIT